MTYNWRVDGFPPAPPVRRARGKHTQKDCNTMDSKTELQAVDHNQMILISEDGSAVLVTPGRCVQLQVVTNAVLNAEDKNRQDRSDPAYGRRR